jgi:hypothetical protein
MFVCTTEKEAKKRTQKLGDLKQLVEAIEEKMMIPCSLVCCPRCAPPCLPLQELCPEEPPAPPQPPDVMVCYKMEKIEKRKNGRPAKRNNRPRRTTRAKSRELRASILYIGCDCEKRNGLQDDCRRTGCHGSPECLTKPEPICGPSEFSNGKHLGKKFGTAEEKADDNDNCEDEGSGRVTVYYNCYPAVVKC